MLAVGVFSALLLPNLATAVSGILPVMVMVVFCLAAARLDLGALLARSLKPRRVVTLAAWISALMVLTPVLFWAAGRVAGLPEALVAGLIYTAAAPPIMSSAALCLMLGLDAAFALEITVVASLMTPLIGPPVTRLLLGEAVPIEPGLLALRTGAMIVIGVGAGALLRRLLGARWIDGHKAAFDGLAAVAMVLFIFPLFDGVGAMLTAEPGFGLAVFALTVLANLGVQLAAWAALAAILGRTRALLPATVGAAALMWGNRTVALYAAALPPEPIFQLYVALYQIPMLLTPLIMARLFSPQFPTRT